MIKKIIPNIDTDNDLGRWIWLNLVPKSGQSKYVQGELLRIIEKLRYESQNNGNANWDKDFELLIDYLEDKILSEGDLPLKKVSQIKKDLKRLRDFKKAYIKDDLYDRVSEEIFRFCRNNPTLITHKRNPKLKR